MDKYFSLFNLDIYYDKNRPGYYIHNRKIASIGLSYTNNRSNHGVSIHIKPDLNNFNKIKPCNLSEVKATSLYNEGINISIEESKIILKSIISEVFNETQSQSPFI